MSAARREPCSACPYRVDVPAGVWASEEYDKLDPYDLPTPAQPPGVFACHATPEWLCHGWVAVSVRRGEVDHAYESLALRIAAAPFGRPIEAPSDSGVELFASHTDAADWGRAGVTDPDLVARLTIDRLARKYPRLRSDG
jgi:hypothetical protein